MKSPWQMTKRDFPKGEPVFKMKRGYLWRHNGEGYTNDVSEAHQYPRDEAIKYCFQGTRINGGKYPGENTIAVPVRYHLRNHGLTYEEILKRIECLKKLLKYAERESNDIPN